MDAICAICSNANAIPVSRCLKCGMAFCFSCVSNKDIRYCRNCVSLEEVIVTINEDSRVDVDYDLATEKETRTTHKVRKIAFSGAHWRFMVNHIHELPLDSIVKEVEYYKAVTNLMEQELLTRRINSERAAIIRTSEAKKHKIAITVAKFQQKQTEKEKKKKNGGLDMSKLSPADRKAIIQFLKGTGNGQG